MAQVQIISDTENFTKELVSQLKSSLLVELKKEFTPKQPTEFLTRSAVSELLSVDPSTVDNWARSKKLIRYNLGNRVYFKRSEIEQSLITIK